MFAEGFLAGEGFVTYLTLYSRSKGLLNLLEDIEVMIIVFASGNILFLNSCRNSQEFEGITLFPQAYFSLRNIIVYDIQFSFIGEKEKIETSAVRI